MLDLRRREFITLIGGAAAVAWPLCARAQEAARQHLIGFVTGLSEAELRPLAGAFRARLQELGWFEGRNVIIDARGTAGDFDRLVTDAAALEHVPPQVNQGDSRGAEDGRGYRH